MVQYNQLLSTAQYSTADECSLIRKRGGISKSKWSVYSLVKDYKDAAAAADAAAADNMGQGEEQ